MSDGIKLCDCCGLTYDSPECPYCNRVTDKDRIEELEDQLSKAVDFIEDLLSGRDRDDDWRIEANAILAAQKGQDDE